MIEIVRHNTLRVYSLGQAQDILQLVYRMTEDASKQAKYLMGCLEALPDKKSERAQEYQEQINVIITRWQNKIERLGAKPKGLWLVDFDNGQGFFCWKFPETQISFHHGYQDGFTGRKMISQKEILHYENSPQPNQ